jgi:DNA-binding transcriptional LysR family regulator
VVRPINLRQVEIFKAVIEHGTVSRAAEVMAISQPAASKLLVHLEADTQLALFDRQKGRLVPTQVALRLYEEVDRIFSSVRQVELAVESVRQEDRGRLSIGVIPALSERFIQRTTTHFMSSNPKIYCEIEPLSSQWIAETLRTRRIDFGIMTSKVSDPNLTTELLSVDPLVCILPKGHSLSAQKTIRPEHLNGLPFISFKSDSLIGQKVGEMFDRFNVSMNKVLTAHSNMTVRQFVAAGQGVSLVHPLFVSDIADHIVIRPFEPSISVEILLCYATGARNIDLIQSYISSCKAEVSAISDELSGRPKA